MENQFGLERFDADEPGATRAEEAPLADGSSAGAPAERRKHARYAVDGDAEVLLADGSQIFRGRVLDISLSGCFVATRARLRMAVGAPVERSEEHTSELQSL